MGLSISPRSHVPPLYVGRWLSLQLSSLILPLGGTALKAVVRELGAWPGASLGVSAATTSLRRYKVTQAELFALLCRLADELLFRQIAWIKRLPFFCELPIKDYTCLLGATWQELLLLASLTVYSRQIFGDLADVTAKYSPSEDELHR